MGLAINNLDDYLGEQVYFRGVEINMFSVEEMLNDMFKDVREQLTTVSNTMAKLEAIHQVRSDENKEMKEGLSNLKDGLDCLKDALEDHIKKEKSIIRKSTKIIIAAFVVIGTVVGGIVVTHSDKVAYQAIEYLNPHVKSEVNK